MFVIDIEFGTPEYDEMVQLRTKILRKPLGLSFLEAQLAEEWRDILLGVYDTTWQLRGCLILSPLTEGEVKMRQVAIDDSVQGQGFGRFLVAKSEEIARQRGFRTMVLNARETAVPFYLKQNYTIEGRPFEEVGIPHHKMKKGL